MPTPRKITLGQCILWLLNGLISLAQADTRDLAQFVDEIKQNARPITPPPVPQLSAGVVSISLPLENNIFSSERSNHLDQGVLRQQYKLKQLQMVGYMRYLAMEYAFLKTPFATIKVKTGDRIQDGKVLKITATRVEISNREIEQDKLANGILILELKPANSQSSAKSSRK